MADLNSYLDFTVALNKSDSLPAINLVNTSAYPAGVAAGITSSIFSITQPDGITVSGASLNAELRLATDRNFQKGLYSVTFTVAHPSYTGPNVLTKTFSVYYEAPKLSLKNSFDVFTPSLKVYDQTAYALPNFGTPVIVRSWSAIIQTIAAITGTGSAEFDLAYQGFYYDSKYNVTLSSTITYPIKGYSWASIIDKITLSAYYVTEIPLTLNELWIKLTAYKLKYIKDPCCKEGKDDYKTNYMYAFILFEHFRQRGNCGANRVDIKDMIDEIYQVINNGISHVYSVTNNIINTYSFTDFCGCGCGSQTQSGILPLSITTQPISQTVVERNAVTFTVVASGSFAPYTYQWRKNGINIPGATASSLSFLSTIIGNAGSYDVVIHSLDNSIISSNTATLTVNPYVALAVTTPTGFTKIVGQSVTFSATASGGTGPYTYQWQKNGTNILGATSASYTIPSLSLVDGGNYQLLVTDAVSSTTTSGVAILVVNPYISLAVTAPQNSSKITGESVTFSAVASGGTSPYTYQWQKNGVNISGATSSSYTIPSLVLSDAGNYRLVVTDTASATVTSAVAVLAVTNPSLTIVTQPVSQQVIVGSPVTFSVAVSGGTTPYAYQWQKNNVNIPGAISNTFTINSAATGDSDNYKAIINDSNAGTITSSTAVLIVTTVTAIVFTYGYSATNPYINGTTAPTIENAITTNITHNTDISVFFPAAAADKFLVFREAVTENPKTSYYHNSDNSGIIPGVFRAWTVGPYRYYSTVAEFVLTYTDAVQLKQ